MRIKISKHQLLRQLPDKVRTDLVSCNDLPDHFVFDVFSQEYPEAPKDGKREKSRGEDVDHVGLKKSHPQVAAILTGMEWYMFCVMLKHPNGASVHQLAGKLKHPEVNMANSVSVHIKGIRRKLQKIGSPFFIQTKRADVLSAGGYKLSTKV